MVRDVGHASNYVACTRTPGAEYSRGHLPNMQRLSCAMRFEQCPDLVVFRYGKRS
jgi:hypothetical protein